MHEIESDLEEETLPSSYSCPITIPTILSSIVSKTQTTGNPLQGLIHDHYFSNINMSQIITSNNGTSIVSLPIHIVIPFSITTQVISSQSPLSFSQPSTSSIPITYTKTITYAIASIPLPSISHCSTPSINIPQVTMPIPTPVIPQPVPLVIVFEETIPTAEEVAYFGEDTVESIGEYFWSRAKKAMVKKGSKRSREGTFKQG